MTRRSRQEGLGLTEVLVSLAVLTLAMTTALVLYDGARRSFRLNENIIDQQQVVRIAFDMLGSDLRMAGLNTNPDGNEDRPDEQIEAAYPTAIVVRADLDAETAEARTPEAALETAGIFDAVSTGNDEIVGYALGSPASSYALIYHADVGGRTRDGVVERVSVPRIADVHDAPPYTLYRITLDEDGAVVKTALADNVRSMRFKYLDQAGNEVPAVGGGEAEADIRTRATIRRILVEIEGLTREADRDWVDADDTNAYSRTRRKFSLSGEITPRNLGMKGLMDLASELTLPPPNTTPILVPGHCQGLYVKWSVAPRDQWAYRVSYRDSDGANGDVTASGDGTYVDGLTDGRLHHVTLRSMDPFGNVGDPTPESSATTSNIAAPAAPGNLAATDDLDGRIDVSWDALTANDGPIAGDPQSPFLRDLKRYLIQRRPAGTGSWQSRFRPPTPSPSYVETAVVPCVEYEFRARGQDLCDANGPWSALANGMAQSTVEPLGPSNIEAFLVGAGPDVRVRWQKVDYNVDGDPVGVDYEIYRVYWAQGAAPMDLGLYQHVATVPGNTFPLQYLDTTVSIPPSQTVYYRVVAADGCGNASQPSDAAEPVTCEFTGEVQFLQPQWGDEASGPVTVRVEVTGGSETYTEMQLEFTNLDTMITDPVVVCPIPGPCAETIGPGWKRWAVDWNNLAARPHRIEATVTTSDECSTTRTVFVTGDE